MPRRERPLESGNDDLLAFARDLRRLRDEAGRPTYRQLSARAHYSAAALSEAASGRKLPTLAVTLAYVTACHGDTTTWENRWREIAVNMNHVEADDNGAPYTGLAAFQPDDAERFFGREVLIADLTNRLAERRFLAVFGASGSGKSSVLRAGLMARLEHTLLMTPGSCPVEECAVGLAGMLDTPATALRSELAADPANLHLRIRQALTDRPATDLVLVVDQFEELFTLCGTEEERDWLIEALTTAAFSPASRTRVVIGVRADFYAHCGRHPRLVAALRDAQVLIGPMTPDELRLAITEPAARAGLRVETALVSRVVADAAHQVGILPQVSHALLETWRRRRGTTLTLAGYEAAGGILDALARTAETVHDGLDAHRQAISRGIFLRLCALGEGTEDTKRRISRSELDDSDPDTAGVLHQLAGARLVSLDRDGVEITHEALIRHWPRLRDWLSTDRDGLRIHRQLTEATAIWEAHDRDAGALYRGIRLAIAQDWVSTRAPTLTPRERAFLDSSRLTQARELAQARLRTRRVRRLVALLAVLLLVTTAATVYAVRANQAAARQRESTLAHRVIRDAAALRRAEPALAARLALTAFQLDSTPDTRGSVLGVATMVYGSRATGHQARLRALAASPDGSLIATASDDGTARLSGLTSVNLTELAVLGNHADAVTAVAISPDGQLAATASLDGTVALWDIARPSQSSPLGQLPGHDGVLSLAFSPDGRTLATGGLDRRIRLWDVTRGAPVRLLAAMPDDNPTFSMAFSPRRPLLVTGSTSNAQFWDITDRTSPRRLRAGTEEDGLVQSVAFAPDDRSLVTAGSQNAARLWELIDPDLPRLLAPLKEPGDVVNAAAYSPDGRRVATASVSGTVRLWDITDLRHPAALATLGGLGSITALSFSADGRTVFAAGGDTTIRLIETDVDRAASTICASTAPISRADWAQYFPGLSYRPSCP